MIDDFSTCSMGFVLRFQPLVLGECMKIPLSTPSPNISTSMIFLQVNPSPMFHHQAFQVPKKWKVLCLFRLFFFWMGDDVCLTSPSHTAPVSTVNLDFGYHWISLSKKTHLVRTPKKSSFKFLGIRSSPLTFILRGYDLPFHTSLTQVWLDVEGKTVIILRHQPKQCTIFWGNNGKSLKFTIHLQLWSPPNR